MASKRAAAAISSAADGDVVEEEALGPGEAGGKKPRTLLEASKELKKASANMDAGTVAKMRAKEEEQRLLREANQVGLFWWCRVMLVLVMFDGGGGGVELVLCWSSCPFRRCF